MAIAVVLAAGSGTRFGKQSKLLANLWGRHVVEYPIELCKKLGISEINLVVNDEKDFAKFGCKIHKQQNAYGTGAAVRSVVRAAMQEDVLVLLGDCPLVDIDDIKLAFEKLIDHDLVIGGVRENGNHNYGRIMIENGAVKSIEESTVSNTNTEFRNAGWMLCKGGIFYDLLSKIPEINGEYYLTECVRLANEFGFKVAMCECKYDVGINTLQEYRIVSSLVQSKLKERAICNGAIFMDIDSVLLSYDTTIHGQVTIGPYVVFNGKVDVHSDCVIKPFSYVEDCFIGSGSIIGPFAHIRSGTYLESNVTLGAFVEIKDSIMGKGSKSKHLSYIGNVEVKENANIGAGTVFCNYDGKMKHKSIVGKNSFLGANTTYVSPVDIGDDAIIGAGSVITKNVTKGSLAVSRSEQKEYRRKS
ncbi:MAG: NTP transferase domain-containing protein [Alphaproteobacteria bacterium]|nr:MAG: NTP transferase domain-containing protein [Alphaproteobacteria bacterium]